MTPSEEVYQRNAVVRSGEDRRKRIAAMWEGEQERRVAIRRQDDRDYVAIAAMWEGEQERRSGTERRAVPTAGQLLWCTKLPNPGFIPPSTEGKYMGNTFTPADDLRLEY
jgi:hypothetical protein